MTKQAVRYKHGLRSRRKEQASWRTTDPAAPCRGGRGWAGAMWKRLLGWLRHGTSQAAALLRAQGMDLADARAELLRVGPTLGPRVDPADALRSLGIEVAEVWRRLDAGFGTHAVQAAERRVRGGCHSVRHSLHRECLGRTATTEAGQDVEARPYWCLACDRVLNLSLCATFRQNSWWCRGRRARRGVRDGWV